MSIKINGIGLAFLNRYIYRNRRYITNAKQMIPPIITIRQPNLLIKYRDDFKFLLN